MDTFDAIYQRRSIKHYDPAHRMTEEEIQKLMDSALQSPTSFNIQHWRFVLVRDNALRQELKGAAFGQNQVTDASILLILTADVKSFEKAPERYWANAPAETTAMMVKMLVGIYDGKEQLQRDEAMRSLGIAAQTIMLAAKALGYDTCPMVGYNPDKVADIINLPEDHVLGMMITVGKAIKEAWPKPGQLPLNEVVIQNRFE
ncbi:MAG: nitroreductase family protein [Pirellulaceae bacterium]